MSNAAGIPFAADGPWIPIRDGNPLAFDLFRRHYSFNRKRDQMKFWPDGADKQFVGPGEKLLLITGDGKALYAFRAERYRMDGQTGVNCAIFRNEGTNAGRASDLILAADKLAHQRWPAERIFTFVDPEKVNSRHPGYCYLCAGYKKCGVTKSGKLIFEKTLHG